jgi:hypothetical protein
MTQTTAAGTCTIRTQPGRPETTHALPQAIQNELSKPDLDAKTQKLHLPSFGVCKQPKSEKIHTSHFTLHTSHFSLPTASFTLHTSHFPLLPSHSNATARSNLDTAITMRSAETELQNTIELRATASEIVAPKPDLDARAENLYF